MGLISDTLTAHGDKYYIYLHLSSNSTHKWPISAQVMSAVARGYSRSRTTFQFLTSFVWAKLQRRQWKFTAWLSHALRAANPSSADSGEFKRVATRFFFFYEHNDSPKPGLLRGACCFWGGKFLILLREEFLANDRTERGMLIPLAHEGKGSNSAVPGWSRELEPGHPAEQVNTLSRGHQPLRNELLSCPFPFWSKHFGLCIILTWNRGFPEVWKKTSLD